MKLVIAFEAVLYRALGTRVVGYAGPPIDHIFAVGRRAPLVQMRILDNQLVYGALIVLFHYFTGDQFSHIIWCCLTLAVLSGAVDRNATVVDLHLHVCLHAIGVEDVCAVLEQKHLASLGRVIANKTSVLLLLIIQPLFFSPLLRFIKLGHLLFNFFCAFSLLIVGNFFDLRRILGFVDQGRSQSI